jgi:hypothetical protein
MSFLANLKTKDRERSLFSPGSNSVAALAIAELGRSSTRGYEVRLLWKFKAATD